MLPTYPLSKVVLLILLVLLTFYVTMDITLYFRIQNYPLQSGDGVIDGDSNYTGGGHARYGDVAWVPCTYNPLCDVTVKAVLLDHTNYYVFAPLVTFVDRLLAISQRKYVTPNIISGGHVLVAMLAAKCVSSDSLGERRLGVLLFQLRTFLDDLDGHVARVRKHVRGERSEVGTSGYYVDGLCDALGVVSLVVGAFVYLKNNPPRRGYVQLPTTNDGKEAGLMMYKSKVTSSKVARKLSCFGAQLFLSSLAWNRYIALYQDMLEGDVTPLRGPYDAQKRLVVFRSSFFFTVTWLWRVVNVHNMLHCFLLAIFCDKLWEFLRHVQYFGFGVLLFVIGITEVHVTEAGKFLAGKYFETY